MEQFLFYFILAQHLIQLTIVFSYHDWLILVSPVMHSNGLRHTLLIVLLLFLLMGTYNLLEIFLMESPKALISIHSYADDIQLNVKCTSDINFAPNLMSNCIKSIHTWFSNNSISLNPNKTETIFLHLPSPRRPLTVPSFIMVNNHNILYSDNIKYLGVYFDSSLSFHRHI